MEPLTIETFNPDMIKVIDSNRKKLVTLIIPQLSSNTMEVRSLPLGSRENSDYLDSRIPEEIFTRYQ